MAKPGESDQVFTEHGMAVMVKCSVCNGVDKQLEYLWKLSGLNAAERQFCFDEYWSHIHGVEALNAAVETLNRGYGWLTLAGGYGCGKTYLLMAIVNEAMNRGRRAVYIGMEQLLEHLRAAYKPGAEVDYDGLWENVIKTDVLCLDEIERYNATPWAETRIQQLLDGRYRSFTTCTTVLATNDLPSCPGWLKSRILDGRFTVVQLRGIDVRPKLRA